MIVTRKTAEGFLGKSLDSLGSIDPKMRGKVSYYVLSADGTKNLGGPYTKPDAADRLRQVEYFKSNPAPPTTAIEAKRNATEDYDAGLITKSEMQKVHRQANAILSAARPNKNPRKELYIQPNKAAMKAAKRGLEARKRAPKSKKGGLSAMQAAEHGIGSGVLRARDIAAGKKINAYQVKAFFDRHRQNYLNAKLKGLKPEESKAIQAWLLWGGEPLRKQVEKAVEKDRVKKENPRSSAELRLMPYHERRKFRIKDMRARHGIEAWIFENGKKVAGPFLDLDEAKDALVLQVAPPLTREEHEAIEKLLSLLSRQGMDPQFKMDSVSGSSRGLDSEVSISMDPSLYWGREVSDTEGFKRLIEPTMGEAGIDIQLFPKVSLKKARDRIELRMKTPMRKLHRYPYYKELMLQPPSDNPKRRLNPKPFHQREHDWNEVLIQRPGKKLTRKQVLDYYKKNTRNIWPYLEGQTVIVILAPSKNNFILRRKRAKGEKHIKLTKLKGIDDERSFEYWIHRRAIEFHPVLTGKMTPILWLDLDMHTTKSAAARKKLFDKMKKAAPRIRRVFRKFGINRIYVYESGQDGGLHFEGDLKKRRNVDRLRKSFTEALAAAFEDDPVFTTGLAKSGQIRLDTSTLHTLGSLRAPYSMTVTGQAKRRISV